MQGENFIGRFEHIFHGYLNEALHLHLKRLQKSFFFFWTPRQLFTTYLLQTATNLCSNLRYWHRDDPRTL